MSRPDEMPLHEALTAESGSRHGYPTSAMAGDYVRAAAGLLPSAALLAAVPTGPAATVILGGFAAIFAVFGLRTVVRHGTSIELGEDGLRATGTRQQTIRWAELDRFKLSYYSTRRDRRSGWMQLELGAGRTRVQIDSRIAGFDEVVRRAVSAAEARGVPLSEATGANLDALGIKSFGGERR